MLPLFPQLSMSHSQSHVHPTSLSSLTFQMLHHVRAHCHFLCLDMSWAAFRTYHTCSFTLLCLNFFGEITYGSPFTPWVMLSRSSCSYMICLKPFLDASKVSRPHSSFPYPNSDHLPIPVIWAQNPRNLCIEVSIVLLAYKQTAG